MAVPSWSRRLWKTGLWTLSVLLVLALVVAGLSFWSVRRPFPTHSGELTLPGLSAPVTVYRDAYGIPQIYAETAEDLFRAQGFVHAQDRFWEMDFRRHVTAGRLSELFGDGQLSTDIFLRTMGWRRVAEAEWELLEPTTQRYLTAYADGVNAWIEATGGPAATSGKSLHYQVLGLQNPGYEIEPWHPVDTLAWLKAMAWDLRGNMEEEINRLALLHAGLSVAQIEELYPAYPYDHHIPILGEGTVVEGEFVPAPAVEPEPPVDDPGGQAGEFPIDPTVLREAAPALAAVQEAARQVPPLLGVNDAGLGSNSWVVSGTHTDTGAPLLVNDPHLGVSLPGIWYQVGLHCTCGYQVSGFGFSGVPGVVIGHNDRIAWGFTNLDPDVIDLFVERVDGDRYLVDGEWRELETLTETIRVAGGDDVTIEVRYTHRGPLITDADTALHEAVSDPAVTDTVTAQADTAPAAGGEEYAVSLAWTALTPGRTIEALFVLNTARDFTDFRRAAALFEVPAQNLIYADIDGNIGYQSPGKVPVRGAGDGRWPAPGWDSAYDWEDYLPFEQLPYVYNPAEGLIVTANQAVIGPQYQPLLTTDWGFGHRGNRIHDLLAEAIAAGPISVSDMERMLFDNYHPLAEVLVPALLAAPQTPLSKDEQTALDLLRTWDYQQPAGGKAGTPEAASSAAAAYFNAVWRNLLSLTFDELPADHAPGGGGRWFEVVTGLLAEPESPWWDRVDTPEQETRDDILSQALADAYREVAIDQGDDPTGWRWGRMHLLWLEDSSLGQSGIAPVEALFNRGPYEAAGGTQTVNATNWVASAGYEVDASPSMRMVVDLSDLDASRWIQSTGNSGHPYHPNYTDQVELWLEGRMLDWRWSRDAVEDAATATLVLTP
ncbi:MAG TPA: penicillin acylase family protein [Natronosporangium sp.]|nr:penicillin acylase family protein [Natronosporangium sp.]